jgi:Ca2+-binding EF-hand superfamily protein
MNMPGNKVDNNNSNININNMNNTNNKVYISIKIEDDCNMTSIVWYPLSHQKEKEIVISNDAYKIKAVNVNDSLNTANSLSIIKTSLGPCFGGPIQVMRVIPGKDKTKRLIAFATREKVLGLMCLPIDGNPFRYMGVIAHPGIIKDVKPATNASYIFTTGGDDYTINIWKYNINPLIEAVENGGDGIKPFLNLLEGGIEGKKYKEMVDYFYYAQIKSKDENTTKHRVLDQTVAINCIHGLLASLGYYPSIEEINNIQREVRHMKHLENAKEKSDDINFETFVKIYLNHRPYIELDVDKIEDSFDNMKNQVKYHLTHDDNDTIIVRERLIECLQEIKYEDKKKDDKGVVTVELKRKVDDATIEAIIKELDENSNEQPITSIEHYQKKLHREKFLDLLKDYKIDDKDVDAMCFKLTGENMNNLPTTLLYKMGDRLISRENFLHMLKENGEKLTDEEIASILKVLVGDPDPTHLPPMLSFDYIFENILLMEKEDREVNK